LISYQNLLHFSLPFSLELSSFAILDPNWIALFGNSLEPVSPRDLAT
jgi:hypothetical protein